MAPRDIDSTHIAKLVGVSRSTVSKVINNYPNISDSTRQRVLEAVRNHQYYPDYSAQILAGKRTSTIGLFFANEGTWSKDVHTSQMVATMIEQAAKLGYHILTYVITNPSSRESSATMKEVFYQRRIDAGLFLGFNNHEPVIEELIAEGVIAGIFDQELPGRMEPNRIVVNFDDRSAAAAAIDYLVNLGHSRIAILNGDLNRNAWQAKYQGYLVGMERNAVPLNKDWIMFTDLGDNHVDAVIERFLSRSSPLPTALAAVNDSYAFSAIRALNAAGLRVPEDISVIGMDGQILSEFFRPALTTFAFDFSAMLERLVGSVVSAIENPDQPRRVQTVFPGTLVERESCRRL